MNRNNPDYPELIRDTVEGMVEVVKNNYEPYFEPATIDDICHYELHVICSFLMRFLIKMKEVSKDSKGNNLTIQMAFDELCIILQRCITEYAEEKNKQEH